MNPKISLIEPVKEEAVEELKTVIDGVICTPLSVARERKNTKFAGLILDKSCEVRQSKRSVKYRRTLAVPYLRKAFVVETVYLGDAGFVVALPGRRMVTRSRYLSFIATRRVTVLTEYMVPGEFPPMRKSSDRSCCEESLRGEAGGGEGGYLKSELLKICGARKKRAGWLSRWRGGGWGRRPYGTDEGNTNPVAKNFHVGF